MRLCAVLHALGYRHAMMRVPPPNSVFLAARRPSRDTVRRRAIARTLSDGSVPISARGGSPASSERLSMGLTRLLQQNPMHG